MNAGGMPVDILPAAVSGKVPRRFGGVRGGDTYGTMESDYQGAEQPRQPGGAVGTGGARKQHRNTKPSGGDHGGDGRTGGG